MTLTFTQENGLYVAEFEATAPFSIHLERPRGGFINMLQRSVDSGTFVAVKNFNPNYNATQVIDADCGQGAVYPKWIRIESAVEPSVAEVTFESESSGGGAGNADSGDWEYYDVSSTVESSDNRDIELFGSYFSGLMKMVEYRDGVMTPKRIGPTLYAYAASDYEFYSQIAINMATPCIDLNGSYTLREAIEQDSNKQLATVYAGLVATYPRITKEEFYNLEA